MLPFLVEKRTLKLSAVYSFFGISRKNLIKTRPRCRLKGLQLLPLPCQQAEPGIQQLAEV